jgi:hypothetical protein
VTVWGARRGTPDVMEQRHESAAPPGPSRERVLADVEREQGPLRARQGATPGADPSVRRGLARRTLAFAAVGALVGVAVALALIPVLWSVPLVIALAAVGAVIGGVLAALVAGEREDGMVDRRVPR